jgi:orotate phosphoribosyltransferase-like protein
MNLREKAELRQLWIARMCEMEESGLTKEEWCRSKGIPCSTMRYWLRKFKRETDNSNATIDWLKVDLTGEKGIAAICPVF